MTQQADDAGRATPAPDPDAPAADDHRPAAPPAAPARNTVGGDPHPANEDRRSDDADSEDDPDR